MNTARQIVEALPTALISREYSHSVHADPARRGGYLLIVPGELPEIVLDGLASSQEQERARQRCLKELEAAMENAQVQSGQDREVEQKRRAVVRIETDLVITRGMDPAAHLDPARRGGYLLRVPGKVPEIVLDGLATPEEQERAERRLRSLLQAPEPGGAASLNALLQQRRQSSVPRPAGVTPTPSARTGSITPTPSARTGSTTPASRAGLGSANTPLAGRLLGERLLAQGLIGPEALEAALRLQGSLGGGRPVRRLGSLLIESRAVAAAPVAQALGRMRGVEASSGTTNRVEPSLRKVFPLEAMVELQAAPLCLVGQTLVVAMCDPHLKEHVATLQALTRFRLRPLQAVQLQVQRLIDSVRASGKSTPIPI